MDVRVVDRGIEADRRARSEVCRRCGRIVSVCNPNALVYVEIMKAKGEAYGVYASRSFFLWQAAYLQGDLHEGAGNQAREDYAAEGRVEEGLKVALFGTLG
jgi:ferredoxin